MENHPPGSPNGTIVLEVHVGHLIRELMKMKQIKFSALVPFMHTNKTNISKLLNKPDWRYSEIRDASQCIGINLFSFFINPSEPTSIVQEDTIAYGIAKGNKELLECSERLQTERELREKSEEIAKLQRDRIRELERQLNAGT